jgi:GT2 family glycosyltransferase
MDGTVEMLRTSFPDVFVIQSEFNQGVGPARNIAFRLARGRYIASLDADMRLEENSMKVLVDFMDQHLSAGLCGCKLVYDDKTVQMSARRYPSLLALAFRRLSWISCIRDGKVLRAHEMREWDRSDNREVDYVIGACHFIRRKAMQEVGLYDEAIFYGPEDVDYCLRMHRKGWTVYFCAGAQIIHKEQRVTRKRLFSRLTVAHILGILYFYRKHGWRINP